ncbi:hypothetical protein [Arenivirga flava]|uniref:Uncharacterized protein n=1 Tax=Arenivirga flava TaxID=1930060 RepID=A0AA37ULP3_9MICO|nr:hypothetical protein [Arenivirga flava]GMA28865.1 hypothetical protein GCM10025874_21180 [Arenivirga flava]
MSVLRSAFAIIQERRKAFIVLNLAYVAMFGIGILATVIVPELRLGSLGALQGDASASGLGTVIADAYRSGNVAIAALVTLGVNLVTASLLQTTLPSLVIPFLGVVVTMLRGLSWGCCSRLSVRRTRRSSCTG